MLTERDEVFPCRSGTNAHRQPEASVADNIRAEVSLLRSYTVDKG